MRTLHDAAIVLLLCGAGLLPAFAAEWQVVPNEGVEGVMRGQSVAFRKSTENRGSLVLTQPQAMMPNGTKTVVVRYSLEIKSGELPRLAVILLEKGGGAYYGLSALPISMGNDREEPVAVLDPQPTAFSDDSNDKLDGGQVDRIMVSLPFHGPANGTFTVSGVTFSVVPWKPVRPLPVGVDKQRSWTLGHEESVKATLTEQGPCGVHLTATIRGGRHTWLMASRQNEHADLSAYHGLGLTLKALLPKGSVKLLVTLSERSGEQHYFEPETPEADNAATVVIPFTQFRHASWSKKEDGKLDLANLSSITVGMHGRAQETGQADLTVTDLQYVPSK